MAGYWIAEVNVTDPEVYAKYAEATHDVLDQYGAKIIVRGGKRETVEGSHLERIVVIEFPSYDEALACYRSPEYQDAKAIQADAAIRNFSIVESV